MEHGVGDLFNRRFRAAAAAAGRDAKGVEPSADNVFKKLELEAIGKAIQRPRFRIGLIEDNDWTQWEFVDESAVPDGPWREIVTRG